MSRILIVDDKEMMRDSVATMLARKGHTVTVAAGAEPALAKLAERTFDVLITDLQMPEMDGLALLAEVRRHDEQLPVIFMTAYGTVETAVAALKNGAFDYLTKPFSGDELLLSVDRALERARLLKENQILRAAASPAGSPAHRHRMIGDGPCMRALKNHLGRIADSHGTVLVSGESGTGKEVAARWIHEHSPRASMPFLAINCAALSTSLLESELFGHEKGAFTGADRLRKGRFEIADGGTLLLDEISEIAPAIQAKLLRVLQERSFERVGSSSSRAVDVRIIATTNRDLPAEVARGAFREDLYFRINVLPVVMPPLRQIIEEVTEMVPHFLEQVASREGRPVKSIEPAALDLMRQYPWPGNVRELQNVCERAVVLTTQDVIKATLIEPWLQARGTRRPASMIEAAPLATDLQMDLGVVCDGSLTLEDVERETIIATLVRNNGHRQRSAAALGIGVRTLGLKLKKWKEQQIVSETL
ncbi:MAG: sigma-54-dependent Fis family transcriptional regulator [Planctomycetes bacterium]|nr:sigma-54-dependent Fis family transcriptional regulator [Planctomycetota bacterium]